MNKEDEDNLLNWLKDKDVSEVMNLLMRHGNRYSRRILKFFRWFCKYVPIIIMCLHAYGMWDFSQHPREMFITNNENFSCYLFIYFMVYVLPMVLILASSANSTSKCKITKCFCKSTPLVLRNSISFLVSH